MWVTKMARLFEFSSETKVGDFFTFHDGALAYAAVRATIIEVCRRPSETKEGVTETLFKGTAEGPYGFKKAWGFVLHDDSDLLDPEKGARMVSDCKKNMSFSFRSHCRDILEAQFPVAHLSEN